LANFLRESAALGLQEHPLFARTPAATLEPFLDRIHRRRVRRGTLLHTPGEVTPLCLVYEGTLRAYQLTPDGRKLVLDDIGPGGLDGILPLAGQPGHFTEAVDDSTIVCLDWPVLEGLVKADPTIVRRLVELTARRLEQREEQLETLTVRDPTKRLARQLYALARSQGEKDGEGKVVLKRPTHQLLADMLGVRRETVTLHVQELVRARALEMQGRRLIVDLNKLKTIANKIEEVHHG
jgi:CRP-like cAMP-binding protein